MAAHKHAAVIHAYADGQEIQIFKNGEWVDLDEPVRFFQGVEYRIKPAEPERVYPVSQMTDQEIKRAWSDIRDDPMLDYEEERRELMNVALRHACDAGQIVTREEFDRAVGDRKERDRAIGFHVAGCIMHALAKNPGLLPSSEKIEEYIAEVK